MSNKTKEEQLVDFLENNKDKSIEQIASSLGLSINYVRSLVWRIKEDSKNANNIANTKS